MHELHLRVCLIPWLNLNQILFTYFTECSPCSLDDFEKLVKPFTLKPEDWGTACKNPGASPSTSVNTNGIMNIKI